MVVFLLFYFSCLPVKPQTYVWWMSPWVPYLSVFRWVLQSSILNEFEGDSSTFPIKQVPTGKYYPNGKPVLVNFSTWDYYLSIFGFDDGRTRGFCFGIVFLNLIIFRLTALIALRTSSRRYRGKRHFYNPENIVYWILEFLTILLQLSNNISYC